MLRRFLIPLDALLVKIQAIGPNQFKILGSINMGILGPADAQFVHQKIGNSFPNLRVLDKTEKRIGGDRAFVAFLVNGLDAVMLHQKMNHLRDIFLGLERIMRVLNVENGFARRALKGFFDLAEFFGKRNIRNRFDRGRGRSFLRVSEILREN